jgi:hypothetical protein
LVEVIGERVDIKSTSPASPPHNNNNIMAPILISEKKSLDTSGSAFVEERNPRRSYLTQKGGIRNLIPFFLTFVLLIGLYAPAPSLSACRHKHGELTVEERASKILSENPLIGTKSSSQLTWFNNAYQP